MKTYDSGDSRVGLREVTDQMKHENLDKFQKIINSNYKK